MKMLTLVKQHNRMIALFDKTTALTGGDLEAQAHWAKYLCVLSAGFLENGLREVYSSYCSRCSNQRVGRFAGRVLARVKNPKTAKFREITEEFDQHWSASLDQFVHEEGRKDAIDSIMSQRHLIAHGKDSTITLARVREYFDKSVEVIEFLEKQCGIT